MLLFVTTVGTNCVVDAKELLYIFSCMKEYFEEKLKERNENLMFIGPCIIAVVDE